MRPAYAGIEIYEMTHVPQLRDALSRAKVANPTTLLTRFAEELRRAPAACGASTG